MKKNVHLLTTILFCSWMVKNAFAYLFAGEAKLVCEHFGLPSYLRIELAIAKLLGVAALLIPAVPRRVTEWAYAGFAITLISGFIAHVSSGDGWIQALSALLAFALLIASYRTGTQLNKIQKSSV